MILNILGIVYPGSGQIIEIFSSVMKSAYSNIFKLLYPREVPSEKLLKVDLLEKAADNSAKQRKNRPCITEITEPFDCGIYISCKLLPNFEIVKNIFTRLSPGSPLTIFSPFH